MKVGSEAVPLVALLAFGFYGLDAVANQLQHPFVSAFGDAALDGRFTKALFNAKSNMGRMNPPSKCLLERSVCHTRATTSPVHGYALSFA
eukprot:4863348-Amphidinium_carterae.1